MHPYRVATLLVAATLAVAACASSGARTTTASAPKETITRAQIDANHFVNAYDAVSTLHPTWLRRRGDDTFGNPSAFGSLVVYLDGVRMGDAETLRQITASAIVTIRHLDAADATSRFGTGHGQGAILVSTRPDEP